MYELVASGPSGRWGLVMRAPLLPDQERRIALDALRAAGDELAVHEGKVRVRLYKKERSGGVTLQTLEASL